MHKKKVLMTYMESGMGHITSIKSISDNLKRLYPDEFEIVDSYIMQEFGNKAQIKMEKFIIKQTQRTNKIRGYGNFVFFLMEHLGKLGLLKFSHKTFFARAVKETLKAFEKHKPDIIVSTHYFMTYCGLEYKEHVDRNVKIITYNPDNNTHCWWDNREHLFIVNNEYAYFETIGKRKFNPGLVKQVYYTARDEILNANLTREEYRIKLGIPQDKFCVIIADGAYAMGKSKKVVDRLLTTNKPLTIIFLAGKNQKLFNKYNSLKNSDKIKQNITLIVLPFTNNIYEYYKASNLFITKAGPNAILDSVFMNTPIIVDYYAHPIEKATTKLFIDTLGVGKAIYNPKKIKQEVEKFIDNPISLLPYEENTKKIDKTKNGGETIANLIYAESQRNEVFETKDSYKNYLYELAQNEQYDTYTTPINYTNQEKCLNYDEIRKKTVVSKVYSKIVKSILRLFGPIINHVGFRIKIEGKKNLKNVKSGITISNHVHYLDCLWNMHALSLKKKLYITGAPHNFKKGFFGATLKAGGFLPLAASFSENKKFSNYLKEILQDGGFVHFYPEQAMWLKYEQSRPLKKGAFYYASQNNVPIIPIVICFRKSRIKRTLVTVKICQPIYPNKNLTQKENCEYMNQLAQKVYDKTIIDFYNYDQEKYSMDTIQKSKKPKKNK